MKYFCLPSDFKNETIDFYYEINNKYEHSKVLETYGQMAPDNTFGSCRVSKQLPVVDRPILEKYVRYSKDYGIEFNYVVNVTCMQNDELTSQGYLIIKKFLRMLVDIGISSITLALPSLMEICKYVAPRLKIKASTVCQINSPLKAKFYENLGIKRLVLDEDIYRRFDTLQNIREIYSGDLEIIVNSFCLNDCPYKMFHYNSFSHSHIDKELYSYYSRRCRSEHIEAENFMKLNWIRPEDLHYYNEIGINYFKLQGRTNVYTGNPVKALIYYIEGSYEGDLVALLELFSTMRPLSIAEIQVDNRKLDGFFDKFFKFPMECTKVCQNCGYCKGFSEKGIRASDIGITEVIKLIDASMSKEFPGIFD